MRKYIILYGILSILLIVLSRCKEPDTEPEYYWGEATAELNGQQWESKIRGAKSIITGIIQDQFIDIVLDKFNKQGLLRESLYLYKIPKEPQLNRIYPTSAHSEGDTTGVFYSTLEDDGDVILDIYNLDELDTTHFVEITLYDTKTEVIEGTFQISLIRDSSRPKRDSTIADTLRFTDGKFKTKILVKDK